MTPTAATTGENCRCGLFLLSPKTLATKAEMYSSLEVYSITLLSSVTRINKFIVNKKERAPRRNLTLLMTVQERRSVISSCLP